MSRKKSTPQAVLLLPSGIYFFFIEAHLIKGEDTQKGGGVFRIFLGKGWRVLRRAPTSTLCLCMGFVFPIMVVQGCVVYRADV